MKVKRGSIVKEAKSGEIQKLKNKIRRLESDKRKLIAENKDLRERLEENLEFTKRETEDFSVEDLIKAAKTKKDLPNLKKEQECPKCGDRIAIIKTTFGRLLTCKCGYRKKEV